MQRRQKIKRLRRLTRLRFLKIFLAALAVCLYIVVCPIEDTKTGFSDTETITSNAISVASFEGLLELSCGCSKKTCWDESGPFGPIASMDTTGNLMLDFGVITPENANNSPDVFRIKNISDDPIEISFTLSSNLEPLFSSVTLVDVADGKTLLAGQVARVNMKFAPHPKPIGEYQGTLKISACNDFLFRNVPVKVIISRPPENKPPEKGTSGESKRSQSQNAQPEKLSEIDGATNIDILDEIPADTNNSHSACPAPKAPEPVPSPSSDLLDTTPPLVTVISPASERVSGTIEVKVAACDNDEIEPHGQVRGPLGAGIERVILQIDNCQVGDMEKRTDTSYVYSWDTTVVEDGDHTLQAKAYDRAGNEGVSKSINITVDNLPSAPTQIIGAASEDDGTVLSWTSFSESDIAGYNIYRANGLNPSDNTFEKLNSGLLASTAYRDAAVERRNSYCYRVLPVNHSGEELGQAEYRVATVAGENRTDVAWNSNDESDLAGYNVYKRRESNADFEKINAEQLLDCSFTDTHVPEGKQCSYMVTAVDMSGQESNESGILTLELHEFSNEDEFEANGMQNEKLTISCPLGFLIALGLSLTYQQTALFDHARHD